VTASGDTSSSWDVSSQQPPVHCPNDGAVCWVSDEGPTCGFCGWPHRERELPAEPDHLVKAIAADELQHTAVADSGASPVHSLQLAQSRAPGCWPMASNPPTRYGAPGEELKARLDRHLTGAEEALRRQDWSAARAEAENAIQIDPAHPRAYELLARLENAAQGAPERPAARRRTRRSIQVAPDPDLPPPAAVPSPSTRKKSRFALYAGAGPAVVIFAISVSRLFSSTPSSVPESSMSTPAPASPGCAPTTIVSGQPITGNLADDDCTATSRRGRADIFTFDGAGGDNVTVTMRSPFDTYLALLGPDRRVVAENDDADGTNSRIQIRLPTAGTYTIEAMAYSDGEGDYTLTVSGATGLTAATTPVEPPPPPPCDVAAITPGQSITGMLSDADCAASRRPPSKGDRYAFQGSAGQRTTIAMKASFDTYLLLFGPDGTVMAENDDADGTNSRIQTQLPSSGTYTVEAIGFDGNARGTYTLSMTSPCTSTAIAFGQTVAGSLTESDCWAPRRRDSKGDQYTFQGSADQSVTITMTGPFDTYLFLVGPNGGVVAENDDADGTNSRIQTQLPATGTYTVEAVGYGDEARGAYTLRASSVDIVDIVDRFDSCTPLAISLGQTVKGVLADADCETPRWRNSKGDQYTFQGSAGQSLTIALRASFDAYLFLVGPDGKVVAENDDADGTDSRIAIRLPVTGTYRIEAKAYEANQRGAYTLSLNGSAPSVPTPGSADRSGPPAVFGPDQLGRLLRTPRVGPPAVFGPDPLPPPAPVPLPSPAPVPPVAPPPPAPARLIIRADYPIRVTLGRELSGPALSHERSLPAGNYEVEIRAPSLLYVRPTTLPLTLAAGQTFVHTLPPVRRVNVVGNPNTSSVWINGVYVGNEPPYEVPLTVGAHNFRFRWPDGSGTEISRDVTTDGQQIMGRRP